MIDVRRPIGVLGRDRAPARRSATRAASAKRTRFLTRATAAALVLAVIMTLAGSGHPIESGNPFVLQVRVSALQERWAEMVIDGVPAADLAALRSEWIGIQHPQLLGIPLNFLRPEAKAVVDRWQTETDAIWDRNIDMARARAAGAEVDLHDALGTEPRERREARLEALKFASTPAALLRLQIGWELEARLIPIDRDIAEAVGRLTTLAQTAKGLGIPTDPVPALSARATEYVHLKDSERLALSAALISDLARGQEDLQARIAAASLTKKAFKRAADEISIASLYGVSVVTSQARIDKDSRSYSSSTKPAQFDAIRKDLDTVVADLKRKVNLVLSQVHVISGVAFIRQTHALSCEEAAVSMALTHQGIRLSQDQILAEMGADRRPMYIDSLGRVRWGDPYVSFVGNVDGSERNYTGSQANYPPLVRVATAHGARIIAYGYMTAQAIYARVAAGHPVVAWATWDWAWHPRHDYLSFGGRWIPWIGPKYESHVYAVVGVKPGAVLVNDPMRGQYWVAKTTFQAAYSDFMEAIVFA